MRSPITEPTIPSFDRLGDIQIPPSVLRELTIFGEQVYINREDLLNRYKKARRYLMDFLVYCPLEDNQILLNHLHKLNQIFISKISNSQYLEIAPIALNQLVHDIQVWSAKIPKTKEDVVAGSEVLIRRIMNGLLHSDARETRVLIKLFDQINRHLELFITEIDNINFPTQTDKERYPEDYMSLYGKSVNYRILPVFAPHRPFGEIVKELTNLYLYYYPEAQSSQVNELIYDILQDARSTYEINKGIDGIYTKQALQHILRATILHCERPLPNGIKFSNTRPGKLFMDELDASWFWEEVITNIDDIFPEES